MLNLSSNMEGLFHVKHESKNLETRKQEYTKEITIIHLLFENKKTISRIFTRNIAQVTLNAFRL